MLGKRDSPKATFGWLASMKIRSAVTLLASFVLVALIAPLTAGGKAVWHIGYVSAIDRRNPLDDVFDAAMRQLGYVEGQNLVMDCRFPGNQRLEALDDAMRDVVRLNVDLMVVWGGGPALAAKRATSTIPIVFIASRAPVERGIVPSLARPGGNITGVSTYAVETIDPKLFELAKELLPRLSRVAVLRGIDPPGAIAAQANAARSLGLKVIPIPFSIDKDAANASAVIERSGAQALIAPDTPLLFQHRKEIVEFAAKKRLPVIYAFRQAVEDGGLMALSTDLSQLTRRGAVYIDKILKGAKPGDLPVEQPTKMDFVINAKTAKALGLKIPPVLLLRADQVIE